MYTFSILASIQVVLYVQLYLVSFKGNLAEFFFFSQSFPVSAGSNSLISRASFFQSSQKFLYLKRLLASTQKAQIFSLFTVAHKGYGPSCMVRSVIDRKRSEHFQ